ncbi:MAG: SAM-dependent methyltransferase [Opitutae bacterium]|nr:SAM-dependent methyltransferase [Opitutae bacterium]
MELALPENHADNEPDPAYLARMAERREVLREELKQIIPPQTRIVWEVGAGHGHFLTAYAEKHRDQLCVGIDIILERVRRALKKRDRAGLAHLHFVRAEASLFLEVLPPTVTFAAIYVLFPDPWPKKRHHKYRLLQDSYLKNIATRSPAGTPLYFRTDYDPYFEEVQTLLREHPDWRLADSAVWPFEYATVFQQKAPSFQSLIALRK